MRHVSQGLPPGKTGRLSAPFSLDLLSAIRPTAERHLL